MPKIISYLTLLVKLLVVLAGFFGFHVSPAVVVLALASALKHAADEFYDRARAKVAGLKLPADSQARSVPLLALAAFLVVAVFTPTLLTGCGPTQVAGGSGATQSAVTASAVQADIAAFNKQAGTLLLNVATNPMVAQTAGGVAATAITKYADPSNPQQTAKDGASLCQALLGTLDGQVLTQAQATQIGTNLKAGSNSAFIATAAPMLSADLIAVQQQLVAQGATGAQIVSGSTQFLSGALLVFNSLSGTGTTAAPVTN